MALTWTPPRLPRQKTAVHENTAEYAPIVALGARLRNGGTIPPRNFMMSAYTGPEGSYNAVSEFQQIFQRTNNLATAFQATANGGNVEMRRLIRAKVWQYDRQTKRRNGEVVPAGIRNIVDLGGLISNQQPVRFR